MLAIGVMFLLSNAAIAGRMLSTLLGRLERNRG